MFTSRLPDNIHAIIEERAKRRNESKAEALAGLVGDAVDMRGRDGLTSQLAAAQATIEEQERILARHGKRTPKRKRLGVSLSLGEARAVEQAAHAAGMRRGDYLRTCILGAPHTLRALPDGDRPAAALPDGGGRPALPSPDDGR